ncbi:GNAT family N-acetyltransferase [Streptomyces sp. NBC_00118]|uniref:GNAT family N-acetyltransferase n=1 Tax=unclassified Streptomyces TaxID=2593676 RepID=UPI00308DCF5E|nr:GNAT family N-acetyltransferase [Streptomyces sp. NBC_01397]
MGALWVGERVRLRGVEAGDWGAFMRFAEEEESLADLVRVPRSGERLRAWAGEEAGAAGDGDRFRLVVEEARTGDAVGSVGAHRADPRAGVFECGVTIGAGHRREGHAAEAVVMLLRHMFDERRFHKCEARVFAHNEASLAFQRRLGFVEEGRLRDHLFRGGRPHALVLLGMLGREFAPGHRE